MDDKLKELFVTLSLEDDFAKNSKEMGIFKCSRTCRPSFGFKRPLNALEKAELLSFRERACIREREIRECRSRRHMALITAVKDTQSKLQRSGGNAQTRSVINLPKSIDALSAKQCHAVGSSLEEGALDSQSVELCPTPSDSLCPGAPGDLWAANMAAAQANCLDPELVPQPDALRHNEYLPGSSESPALAAVPDEVQRHIDSVEALQEKEEELEAWYEKMRKQLELEQVSLKRKFEEMRLKIVQQQRAHIESSQEYIRCSPVFAGLLACVRENGGLGSSVNASLIKSPQQPYVGSLASAPGSADERGLDLSHRVDAMRRFVLDGVSSPFPHKSDRRVLEKHVYSDADDPGTLQEVSIGEVQCEENEHGRMIDSHDVIADIDVSIEKTSDYKVWPSKVCSQTNRAYGPKRSSVVDNKYVFCVSDLPGKQNQNFFHSLDENSPYNKYDSRLCKGADAARNCSAVGPSPSVRDFHYSDAFESVALTDPGSERPKQVGGGHSTSAVRSSSSQTRSASEDSVKVSSGSGSNIELRASVPWAGYAQVVPRNDDASGQDGCCRPGSDAKVKKDLSFDFERASCKNDAFVAGLKITAVGRGWLTRRLMRTHKVQEIVKTIRDTALAILDIRRETKASARPPSLADKKFLERLEEELVVKREKLHDIFFNVPASERLKLIRTSRLVNEERVHKTTSKAQGSPWQGGRSVDLGKRISAATQRAVKRRQGGYNENILRPKTAPGKISKSKVGNSELRILHPVQSFASPVASEKRGISADASSRYTNRVENQKGLSSNLTHASSPFVSRPWPSYRPMAARLTRQPRMTAVK